MRNVAFAYKRTNELQSSEGLLTTQSGRSWLTNLGQ